MKNKFWIRLLCIIALPVLLAVILSFQSLKLVCVTIEGAYEWNCFSYVSLGGALFDSNHFLSKYGFRFLSVPLVVGGALAVGAILFGMVYPQSRAFSLLAALTAILESFAVVFACWQMWRLYGSTDRKAVIEYQSGSYLVWVTIGLLAVAGLLSWYSSGRGSSRPAAGP